MYSAFFSHISEVPPVSTPKSAATAFLLLERNINPPKMSTSRWPYSKSHRTNTTVSILPLGNVYVRTTFCAEPWGRYVDWFHWITVQSRLVLHDKSQQLTNKVLGTRHVAFKYESIHHHYPSNNRQNISPKIKNVKLLLVLEEKSGDQQSRQNSSSGDHKCLHEM